MTIIRDYRDYAVRLTDERLEHILEHPEMAGHLHTIEDTLREPAVVAQSISDTDAMLYYRRISGDITKTRYLCVVVKVRPDDAFVLTAYQTDKVKKGTVVWSANT